MYKVFTYRLYPTASQRERMESTLETCRRFYNDCLSERRAVYETEGRTLSQYEQAGRVKRHKVNNPFAVEVHSHVLQVVVADLTKTYQAFFRRVKAGESKVGFPRFKSRSRFRSFGYKEVDRGFVIIDGQRLRLTFIGRIAVRWHRPLEGIIKTLRIVCKSGKWYACFCCEVKAAPLPPLATEIGIDVGLSALLTRSDGEKVANPRWYRHSQRRQRVLQRSVSRKKLGGSNRRKAVRLLSHHSEHVANQRKDYLNKVVVGLVAAFGYIAIEDLSITRMVHGNLAKSIMDAGWGYFRRQLLVKAENAGRKTALVDPAYTTQTCCECGVRQKLTLRDRWYHCPCGNSRDRDENAARVVLGLGHSLWASSSSVEGLVQEAVVL